MKITISIIALIMVGILLSCNQKNDIITEQSENLPLHNEIVSNVEDIAKVKRIGMIIKIKADQIEEYRKLHADTNPGVRDLLIKYNMRNFSIFMTRLEDGNYYEFGYYEYSGNDFEGDMAKLALEPRNIEWLKTCDPMQVPLEGAKGWTIMEQVYFNK